MRTGPRFPSTRREAAHPVIVDPSASGVGHPWPRVCTVVRASAYYRGQRSLRWTPPDGDHPGGPDKDPRNPARSAPGPDATGPAPPPAADRGLPETSTSAARWCRRSLARSPARGFDIAATAGIRTGGRDVAARPAGWTGAAVRDGVAPCVRRSWCCCSPSPSRGARSRSCRGAARRPPRRRRETRRTRRPPSRSDDTIDSQPAADDQDTRAGDERTAVSITNEFWSRWFDDQGLRYVPPEVEGGYIGTQRAELRGRAVGAGQRLLLPARELPRLGRGPHARRVQRRSATRGSTW